MFCKDRFDKMNRKDLEEEIRVYKDFSKYTRKKLEEELRILLPEINLNEFSKQELEELLRSNYTFDDYTTKELRKEARRHEFFDVWTREELEEECEDLENLVETKKYNIIWVIIIGIACMLIGYSYGSIQTKLEYLEQRTELFQQELNLIEYQNVQLENEVDTLEDIIDLIILHMLSDELPNTEIPTENI